MRAYNPLLLATEVNYVSLCTTVVLYTRYRFSKHRTLANRKFSSVNMSISNANVLKMNDYETTKFVELYKKESILWNPTISDYKCRVKRTAAAKRIAVSMGLKHFTYMHVIQKFKNLRSSYLQELKKIARSTESIGSNDELYVPKVVWFKLMDSFLRPYVRQRISTANLVSGKVKYYGNLLSLF